jgi:oligopeptide/dipeptide ABC transporter ATP-binding protein
MRLRTDLGLTMLLISHDLAVVNHVSTRVAVMYAGRIVETGPPAEVFRAPAHPYTELLLASIPRGLAGRQPRHQPMSELANPAQSPTGCHFANRCPKVQGICRETAPALISVSSTHTAACHLVGPVSRKETPAPIPFASAPGRNRE